MTTVVLGLDGGSFELIEEWLQAGDLPNLQRLREEGTGVDMQSCLPPVTCPNWQCYATGKNPGKLGVFWWEHVDRDHQSIDSTSASTDFDGVHYWTGLDGTVAAVNLPTSYPPPEINGIHVAGGPGAEQTGYTNPPEYETELVDNYEYRVHPEKLSLLSKDDPDSDCVEEIYDLIEMRFDVLEELLASGEYELIHVTVFYLNVLQHFFWDHEIVRDAWRQIDARLGEILENDSVDNVFVMSDHGSTPIETEFRINTWLEANGYLETTTDVSGYLHRVGITKERIRLILGRLGVEWWARRLVPRRLQNLLPNTEGAVDKTGKQRVIDWERSTAVASSQGPLYVLSTDESERASIRESLLDELDGLRDGNGNTVVEDAVPATSVYEGPYVDTGPDIVLRQGDNVHIDGTVGHENVFGEPDTWRAENKEIGLFLAHGESIASGADLDGMHILDIAPTIFHLHGRGIPDDWDGTVRTELFAESSEPGQRDPEYTEPLEHSRATENETPRDAVTDRLEDLGYIE
jgi:predicted AlkP superfamily phosphohydrolase/phosphomutase